MSYFPSRTFLENVYCSTPPLNSFSIPSTLSILLHLPHSKNSPLPSLIFTMASIKDLLNPMPERTPNPPSQSNEEPWPPFQRWERQRLLQGFRGRKQRIPAVPKTGREAKSKTPKDGAIFKLGKPQGEVRYPPCEERDEDLLKIHREFKLHPLGNIADYPRHIPYNSQKKDFHEKTGRDSFNGTPWTSN